MIFIALYNVEISLIRGPFSFNSKFSHINKSCHFIKAIYVNGCIFELLCIVTFSMLCTVR